MGLSGGGRCKQDKGGAGSWGDIDLQGQVEGSLLMPPAYQIVVSRAQLALVRL